MANLYSQNGITFEAEFVKHSNQYSKSYYLTGMPKYLEPKQVLDTFELNNKTLLDFEFNFTLKLSIENDKGTVLAVRLKWQNQQLQLKPKPLKC